MNIHVDSVPSPDELLDRIPRVLLADIPTPLQEVPWLSRTVGLNRLFIKRDDQTGLAMGGNKARKLEYDFAEILKGNLLLNVLLGAEIRYLKNNDRNDDLASAMDEWAEALRREGRRPYTLPVGGTTGIGALGYVRAMRDRDFT